MCHQIPQQIRQVQNKEQITVCIIFFFWGRIYKWRTLCNKNRGTQSSVSHINSFLNDIFLLFSMEKQMHATESNIKKM